MPIELLFFSTYVLHSLTELFLQAIALSLAEPSQNSVTAIGAETSSAGVKGRKGTPCENKNNTPIQDSAKNRKTKKQVCSFQNGMLSFYPLTCSYLCFTQLHFVSCLLLGQEQNTTVRR
jgi:hypothetical protein